MSSQYFMGIDGGGSTLRLAITDANLNLIASYQQSTANPNLIGHDIAKKHIQESIQTLLERSEIHANEVIAVGIGIAGASNAHSEDWLLSTVSPVLPNSFLVPSSDLEIALVGALGQQDGILVLAGTGSAIFGCSPDEQTLQLGGWGYLLGDEGSGYWIGLQALQRLIQDTEQNYDRFVDYQPSSLNNKILQYLEITSARDLIAWLYRNPDPPTPRVASLSKLIIEEANSGNWDAINLVQHATILLANKVQLMKYQLGTPNTPVAFAGGLLDNDNRLSQELTQRLGLSTRPIAKYPTVIGGALLAQLRWKADQRL